MKLTNVPEVEEYGGLSNDDENPEIAQDQIAWDNSTSQKKKQTSAIK